MVLACFAGWAAASDSRGEIEALREKTADAYWWGDFDAIARIHADVYAPGRRDVDGVSLLVHFRNGVERVTDRSKVAGVYYDNLDALTLQWARRQPASPLAHVLHAHALVAHAWWHRGGGFSNTVPPQAMVAFERYIEAASHYLAANANVAMQISDGWLTLLNIARAKGVSGEQQWAIAKQGLERNPDDDRLYTTMVSSLLPKWGGTRQQLDRFVEDAVARTQAERGLELYARLYDRASEADYGIRLFRDSNASWPRMKQGFEQWQARTPTATKTNRFAYFACMAEDKPTVLDLLEQIGSGPDLKHWGPNAARTFETCRDWARRQ